MSDNMIKEKVLEYYQTWEAFDKEKMATLLHENFSLNSPIDKGLNTETYFINCWKFNSGNQKFNFETIMTHDNEALVRYTCSAGDKDFRCSEYLKFEDGKLREVDIFWGFLPEAP